MNSFSWSSDMANKKPSDFHENVIMQKDETHDVNFYLLSERIVDRYSPTLNGRWLSPSRRPSLLEKNEYSFSPRLRLLTCLVDCRNNVPLTFGDMVQFLQSASFETSTTERIFVMTAGRIRDAPKPSQSFLSKRPNLGSKISTSSVLMRISRVCKEVG